MVISRMQLRKASHELYFAIKTVYLDCQEDLGVFDLFLPERCRAVGILDCPCVGPTNIH